MNKPKGTVYINGRFLWILKSKISDKQNKYNCIRYDFLTNEIEDTWVSLSDYSSGFILKCDSGKTINRKRKGIKSNE